jgi:hypothetical protein
MRMSDGRSMEQLDQKEPRSNGKEVICSGDDDKSNRVECESQARK